MPLEKAIRLIIRVKDMPLGIEESWHVLVSHGQCRVPSLQTRNNAKELLVKCSVNEGQPTQGWAHNELA